LPLNDRQRLTLVYLREREQITNGEYRRLNRVDTIVAGQELRGLVESELVEQQGVGRWTSYQLKASTGLPEKQESQPDEKKILEYVRQHGSINNSECRDLLQVDLHRASHLLKKLHAYGSLKREGERRWARYRLP
jgi:predicted HTH transcriptional regulator